MAPRAVVMGPPGAGKSTIGRMLADRLGVAFCDTDDVVEQTAGKKIADIFTSDGEPVFRALEEKVVAQKLSEQDGVLALGGGSVLSARTRALLTKHRVVFLSVGLAEGARRVGLSTARPLLAGVNPRATYKALLEARLPLYREVATWELKTDNMAPADLVQQLVERLAEVGVGGRCGQQADRPE